MHNCFHSDHEINCACEIGHDHTHDDFLDMTERAQERAVATLRARRCEETLISVLPPRPGTEVLDQELDQLLNSDPSEDPAVLFSKISRSLAEIHGEASQLWPGAQSRVHKAVDNIRDAILVLRGMV